MSDSPSKPAAGDAPRKRRRRRRKPAGDGSPKAPSQNKATPRSKGRSGEGDSPSRSRKRRPKRRGDDARGREAGESKSRAPRDRKSSAPSANRADQTRPDRTRDSEPAKFSEKANSSEKRAPEAPRDESLLGPGDAPWGDDSAAPTPEISLAPNRPADDAKSDWDPVSAQDAGYTGKLGARIANVVSVRFVPAGRLYMYDAGDENFEAGDRVIIDGENGKRIATVGVASRRQPPKRALKRVARRATAADLAPDREEECKEHLKTAKALAKKQGLAIKVFRAQFEGPKRLSLYYACEQKTDVRGLARALSKALPVQVDLRHTGARDEAKMVGGIGSCGQELCCTTWLPAFVPVSIKNAKEQGLVLNPTKVSGQCGRLKCCLVYEQALYSEMRKGLPKMGKRVITNDGLEGRVIEVDVLHQRIRVAIGRGESKVYGKGEVEPMFASQPQSPPKTKSKNKKRKGQGAGSQEPAKGKAAMQDVTKEATNDKD